MAVLKEFADVLSEYHAARKNGALFVSVAAQSENLIRFYFKEGRVYHLSYGSAADRDCLDILDCYDLNKAVYFEGMKSAGSSPGLPATEDLIAMIRKKGKRVMME